jgi:hypothetical protein
VTVVLLLPLLVVSCHGIERDWEDTQKTNTVAAYEQFIQRHPDSTFTAQARQRANDVAIRTAYKHVSEFSGKTGAARITIESRDSGYTVTAGSVKVMVNVTQDKQSVKVDPENTSFKFSLSSLNMDPATADLWSHVTLMLDNGSTLPAKYKKSSFGGEEGIVAIYPDAPNSTAVSIRVDPRLGYTEYAGLRFKKAATAAIRGDGTVEVDADGLEATDNANQRWSSRKVVIDSKPTFVMCKKE